MNRELRCSGPKDTENGKQIAISDPTMKVTGKHTVTLDGVYKLSGTNDKVTVSTVGSTTTVTVDMSGMDGASVSFALVRK